MAVDLRLTLDCVFLILSSYKDGLRVTGPDIIDHVIDAALATKNHIESKLSMGLPNSPMQGSKLRICSGNFVTAHPLESLMAPIFILREKFVEWIFTP